MKNTCLCMSETSLSSDVMESLGGYCVRSVMFSITVQAVFPFLLFSSFTVEKFSFIPILDALYKLFFPVSLFLNPHVKENFMIMCFAGGFMSDISLLGTVLNLFDNFLSFMFPCHSSPFTLSIIPTQWIWSFDWRSSNFLIYFCCCCYRCCIPLSFCWHLLYFWEMFVTFKLSFFDVCNIFTYLNHVITDFFFLLFQSLIFQVSFFVVLLLLFLVSLLYSSLGLCLSCQVANSR